MRTCPVLVAAAGALAIVPALARAQSFLWTAHAATGPASPYGGAMAYHTALGRVVSVNYGAAPTLGTWSWDGNAWMLLSTQGPPRRFWSQAAYDSARNRLVLFGGYNTGPYPSDTWEWDGAAWAQAAAAGPVGRYQHGMVYDAARGRVVLFGGRNTAGAVLGDTWEWDGAGWLQRAVSGPPARAGHAMAYDAGRGRTVVFGGSVGGPSVNDTWEWDGVVWMQGPPPGPSPRSGAAMVYDPGRARLVLVSALGGLPWQPGETWELDGAAGVWVLRAVGAPGASGPMAFDAARGRGVLAGLSLNNVEQVWEWDGAGTTTGAWLTQQPESALHAPGDRAVFTVGAVGAQPLSYRWRRNGTPIFDGGPVTGADTPVLTIDPVAATNTGQYDVMISNGCGAVVSFAATLTVATPCYANCDESTIAPILNVNDFICFQTKYAQNDTYANCDGSTIPPILNVNDFICFQTKFAQGCP